MANGIWVAFGLGLLGSLHCVAMCGPLVLALPQPNGAYKRWAKLVSGRLLYNLGRVSMYALLGTGVGLLGSAARFAGLQQAVSILTGVLILFGLLWPKKMTAQTALALFAAQGIAQLRRFLAPLFHQHFVIAQFGLGMLNGLLPCGLVYVAVAGALAQPGIVSSASFMLLFGAGTFPALLCLSVLSNKIKDNFGHSLRRVLPIGAAALAILLILRGLSLDIPYLSPPLNTVAVASSPHTCH